MSGGMSANKALGGLHNLTLTPTSLVKLKTILEEALTQGKTKFEFQKLTITTVYAQYILRYYGDEGLKKRSIRNH